MNRTQQGEGEPQPPADVASGAQTPFRPGLSLGQATLLLLLAPVLFGTTGTAQALAGAQTAPLAVGALRVAVGGLSLVLVALLDGGPRPMLLVLRRQPLPAAVAALSVAAYQLFFFSAVATTGVALGTLVAIGSGPVFAGLLGLLIGERPGWRWAAATALAVTGVLALVGPDARVVPAGVATALGAGLAYACFTVSARRLLRSGHPSAAVVAASFGVGALLLVPFWLGQNLQQLAGLPGLLLIGWLGFITTALAYRLFASGLRAVPAARATTLGLAEPLTAATLGLLVLHERPTPIGWLGGALIAAGLLVQALPSGRS
ncbi:MAG: EamA family transporter [Candidatus Dormibacteraeota bacterium]|nr:EamA family transporter [Candidatus Dormibacteraeota bacterium]